MLLNTLGTVSTRDAIEVVVICIPIIVTMYYNNYKIRQQNAIAMKKKADIDYVNQQDRALHHRIDDTNDKLDDKADKSLVESMDKKLDLILMKLK